MARRHVKGHIRVHGSHPCANVIARLGGPVDDRAELGHWSMQSTQCAARARDVDDSCQSMANERQRCVGERATQNEEPALVVLYPPGGRVVSAGH